MMESKTEVSAAAIEKLSQMTQGYLAASSLNAVARLGIADLLKDETLSIEELAAKTSTNGDALCRVLRLLAGFGVFHEVSTGKFANNDMSHLMREDVQGSRKDMILFFANPMHLKMYVDMLPTLRDGKTAAYHIWGKEIFDVFAEDEEEQKLFDNALTRYSQNELQAILAAYDFSGIQKLVDVGGGHGFLLTGILQKYPDMRGVLFELPHVTPGADDRMNHLNLQSRCEVVSGDFFESVPSGDTVIMKYILHDWDDEQATTILKNCHKAGASKVLLAEMLLSRRNEPELSRLMDVEMLMLTGGRERTEEEFRKLLEKAGFILNRVVRTKCPLVLLEATASNSAPMNRVLFP